MTSIFEGQAPPKHGLFKTRVIWVPVYVYVYEHLRQLVGGTTSTPGICQKHLCIYNKCLRQAAFSGYVYNLSTDL